MTRDARASCRPWLSGRRVGAPVTAEMVAELRGAGKDFGSEIRDEVRASDRDQRKERQAARLPYNSVTDNEAALSEV